jgi:hypothetical protein
MQIFLVSLLACVVLLLAMREIAHCLGMIIPMNASNTPPRAVVQ